LVVSLLVAVVAAAHGMSPPLPPEPKPVSINICALKPETGRCRGAATRWFHNTATNKCETFTYGGCDGNPNNFVSKEECQKVCPEKKACPEIMCALHCDYGFLTDENGCRRCTCKKSPCDGFVCPTGEMCIAPMIACAGGRCPDDMPVPKPECIRMPCPAVMCRPGTKCQYGYEKDANGCQTCTCKKPTNPCEEHKCPAGHQCVVPEIACDGPACPKPEPTCIAVPCPRIGCVNPCPAGFEKDATGCPTCRCKNDTTSPCDLMRCLPGHRCVEQKVACIRAPCPPLAVCEPLCPLMMCKMHCPWGMKKDDNGCSMCACAHPCDNNTCGKGERCEVHPMMAPRPCFKPPCPPVHSCVNIRQRKKMCNKVCMRICNKGGPRIADLPCPSCKCPTDACATMKCADATTCKSRTVCFGQSKCRSKGRCVRNKTKRNKLFKRAKKQ